MTAGPQLALNSDESALCQLYLTIRDPSIFYYAEAAIKTTKHRKPQVYTSFSFGFAWTHGMISPSRSSRVFLGGDLLVINSLFCRRNSNDYRTTTGPKGDETTNGKAKRYFNQRLCETFFEPTCMFPVSVLNHFRFCSHGLSQWVN